MFYFLNIPGASLVPNYFWKSSHDCKSGLCNLQISHDCNDSVYKKLELGKIIVQMVTFSRPLISHFQNEMKASALVE